MNTRVVVYAVLLIFILIFPVSASSNDDDAWIAAYNYKQSSNQDRFYPFVNIRDHNYRIFDPDAAVKNIIADYDFIQVFKLILMINQTYNGSISNIPDMTRAIQNVINQTTDKTLFEEYLTEMKLLLLLKDEISLQKNFLQSFLGIEGYQNFSYRFYHLKLINFETSAPSNPHISANNNQETKTDVIKAKEEIDGAYVTKLDTLSTEIRGSLKNTEMINAMIPIYPYKITGYRNAPFVSSGTEAMDLNLKQTLLNKFGSKIKFVWLNRVFLYEFRVDQNYLQQVSNFFSLFTDAQLTWMTNIYQGKFNQSYDVSIYNRNSITAILQTIIKL